MVMVRLVIGPKSTSDVIWVSKFNYHIFFASLNFLRYIMIVEKMVILVMTALDFSWLSNWAQLVFQLGQCFRGLLLL